MSPGQRTIEGGSEQAAPGPRVTAIRTALPPHRFSQEEIMDALAGTTLGRSETGRLMLRKIQSNAQVATRHFARPLAELRALTDFTDANRVWLQTALELGEQVLTEALKAAGTRPREVDAVISTTVTGVTVPSLEARLAHRVGLRPDVRRIPLFGNGCAGGAAGLARLREYLLAHPDATAVLLSVELCSLAYQMQDTSLANIVAGSLFGDGAAAVVATGARRHRDGPELVDSQSHLVPDTEEALGWDIGSHGLRILLAPEVPALTAEHLPKAVHDLLGRHALTPDEVATWIVHGGGPKVLTSVERAFDLPPDALEPTRRSLAEHGNLSSASVLNVLHTVMTTPPPAGAPGLIAAMGPGFAIELVLIRW
ncbi:3-oxoacyl-[acyl-carrier-protein] synthase III C-terminal domain-containing protein [Streptomyces griseosporeus]|uniref:3-oxoacyl-[acyl-carrier-protein] synthase III C-terminal domain-containing protein n=1 Tax=Streptomyces griseosporeus TaxID=1910 RepID=A0ABV3L053_STRGS|nr:3-oxoacyl-[acyl-carrier-protein] synthase III C-terminal domain-containing protein [Streptomyces actuosus]